MPATAPKAGAVSSGLTGSFHAHLVTVHFEMQGFADSKSSMGKFQACSLPAQEDLQLKA